MEEPRLVPGHFLQGKSCAESALSDLLQTAVVNRESVKTNLLQFSSLLFPYLGELECFAIRKKLVAVEVSHTLAVRAGWTFLLQLTPDLENYSY